MDEHGGVRTLAEVTEMMGQMREMLAGDEPSKASTDASDALDEMESILVDMAAFLFRDRVAPFMFVAALAGRRRLTPPAEREG